MHDLRPRARRGRLLVPVALGVAGAALLVGGPRGPAPGDAADRYQAGEAATVRSAVPPDAEARIRARGLIHARTFGVPAGAATRVTRVRDRFSGTDVDEVVTTDAAGGRLGIVRMDLDGRLAMAVRLGWRPPTGRRIDVAGARERAVALAVGAGIRGNGTPVVAQTADGGWRAAWDRTIDGVPALGDGSVITLFPDGTFHAAARRERALAAAPSTTLGAAAAGRLAGERLVTLLGPASGQARIVRSRLAWVAPNDTFEPAAPDAPGTVLRLAWVVEVRTAAPLSDSLRGLELYLDAGDGVLLGGDLLR